MRKSPKTFTWFHKAWGIVDQRYSKKVRRLRFYRDALAGKSGIEIGGPSKIFTTKGSIPLYDVFKNLDGCNYRAVTVWNEEMKEGKDQYRFGENRTGYQLIREASALDNVKDGQYDFLLASHCLEHCANPLMTLHEWQRVVKEDGYILIVLPHKEGTFDHRRPVTTLDHVISDYKSGVGEDDLTALEEVLHLHDFSMDRASGTFEFFKERSLKNIENRCLHHHVFNSLSAARVLDYAGLQIKDADVRRPYHIIMLAQKISGQPDNLRFLQAEYYSAISPFGPSDSAA